MFSLTLHPRSLRLLRTSSGAVFVGLAAGVLCGSGPVRYSRQIVEAVPHTNSILLVLVHSPCGLWGGFQNLVERPTLPFFEARVNSNCSEPADANTRNRKGGFAE